MSLSVVIITKNESANVAACLASVSFATEIVLVDGDSSDGTADIARSHGAVVHTRADWPGFGVQKNRALALARCDWVLSLDADERVTPALRAEIEAAMAQDAVRAFRMPRLSSYCGQAIHHAGWYPDFVTRLFRRGEARFSDDVVHERVLVETPVGTLNSPLLHASFKNFEAVLAKMDRYSSASAQALFQQGRRATLMAAVGHGVWAFVRSYIFRRGFLDGQMGLALAISNGQGSYYRYAKLWLLGRDGA
jgi:glycosyltransferase involved in cell wall biosynthesis